MLTKQTSCVVCVCVFNVVVVATLNKSLAGKPDKEVIYFNQFKITSVVMQIDMRAPVRRAPSV